MHGGWHKIVITTSSDLGICRLEAGLPDSDSVVNFDHTVLWGGQTMDQSAITSESGVSLLEEGISTWTPAPRSSIGWWGKRMMIHGLVFILVDILFPD